MYDGHFSPGSPFWNVNRELLVNLCGMRALLLEIAHPLVAAGVAEHSHFRRAGLGRLARTIHAMTRIIYGDQRQAHGGTSHVSRCHRHVRGRLREAVGPFPAGTPYDAHDPGLKLWVWATLVDSALVFHDRFIRSVPPAHVEPYYSDSRRLGRLMGVPDRLVPVDWQAFRRYFDGMTASPELSVGAEGRDLAQALFNRPYLGSLSRAWGFLGVGLLPDRLRSEFGFEWDARRERRLERLAAWSRRLRGLTPDVLATSPWATRAEWRAKRRSAGEKRKGAARATPSP